MKPKVVIDTNVFISAILFSGIASNLTTLWQDRHINFLISKDVLNEYIRVLSYPKFKLSKKEIKYIIQNELIPFIEPISVKSVMKLIKDDPDDNKFLTLAIDGKADYIISGDIHILNLKKYHNVRVISIKDFLYEMGLAC